eukprot:scaffold120209_cov19-Tisochrysis_lutea.AAC.3
MSRCVREGADPRLAFWSSRRRIRAGRTSVASAPACVGACVCAHVVCSRSFEDGLPQRNGIAAPQGQQSAGFTRA